MTLRPIPGTPAHPRWPTRAALRCLHDREEVARVARTTEGCADLWALATEAPLTDPLAYVRAISGDAAGLLTSALQAIPEPGWLSVLMHTDDAVHFNGALTGAIVDALADPTWSPEARQAWVDQAEWNTIASHWGECATYHLPPSHFRRLVRDVVPWFAPLAVGASPQADRATHLLLDSLATTPSSDVEEFGDLLHAFAAVADAGVPLDHAVFCSLLRTWETQLAQWDPAAVRTRQLLPPLATLGTACGDAPRTLRHALLDAGALASWASLIAACTRAPTFAPAYAREDGCREVAAGRPDPLTHLEVLALLLASPNGLLRELAIVGMRDLVPVPTSPVSAHHPR